MDAQELQELIELGEALKDKLAAQEALHQEIEELQKRLQPLVRKQVEYFNGLLPAPPAPPPTPPWPYGEVGAAGAAPDLPLVPQGPLETDQNFRQRVVELVKDGVPPDDIARQLGVRPDKVRVVLADLCSRG